MWRIWKFLFTEKLHAFTWLNMSLFIYFFKKKLKVPEKEFDEKWWKLQKLIGEKNVFENTNGLDFTLRIFHSCCFLSVHLSSRTDDSKSPSLIRPPEPWWHGVEVRSHVSALPQNCGEMQLSSLLGGAVMLLVYEHVNVWLQKNWWWTKKCFPLDLTDVWSAVPWREDS